MKMNFGFGVFETEADHLIEMVRRHAPLSQVRASVCPVCGSAIEVAFAEDGTWFSMACAGKPFHLVPYQYITEPPPWWRECVAAPTESTWYWRVDHLLDASGNIRMPMSGWFVDGVRWSGALECPVGHPDHPFWHWVLTKTGCTSDLIGDKELALLRERFTRETK